jgi:TolA-binding protein
LLLGQIEDRLEALEDKVDELEHSDNNKNRKIRKYQWDIQDLLDTLKRSNLRIMGIEEREKVQTKGIENIQ